MKLQRLVWLVTISFALLRSAFGQGFVNLDFEDATIVPDPSSGYYPYAIYTSDAIPGWTVTGSFLGPNEMLYDDLTLGSPSVDLVDTNNKYGPGPVDGTFSIYLQAFPYGGQNPSISQTGLIPVSAKSLFFEAQQNGFGTPAGTLQVSLGGQNLSFFAVSSGANYTLYGADISAFAGQTKQLTFSANGIGPGDNFWEIDDIQFSPSSVPEPSVFGLLALSGLFLGLRRSK